jgi:ferritin-like metal-binding protein YciE
MCNGGWRGGIRGEEETAMPPSTSDLDRYVLHLNHALAMETALVDHLEKRAAGAPSAKVRERVLAHRSETIEHRDTVRNIINALHAEPTPTTANVQPPVTPGLLGKVLTTLESEKMDRKLDESLGDYAVEQYEAAFYQALGLIARNLGFAEHGAQFEAIRREEMAMADFLAEQLPDLVSEAFPPEAKAA